MSEDARALEVERRRAQRLEVASRMARGIGRELVDLVTVIRGHASLLVEDASADARPSAEAIERATTHAAELARRLLVLGGDGVLTPRRIRLDRLVGDLSSPLAEAAGSAHLDLRLDPATPEVVVDGEHLGRALGDLVGSGVARGSRHLTIAVRPGSPAPDGRPRAIVELRDDGPAIPADVVERWSEPFADDDWGLARAAFHGIVDAVGRVSDPGERAGRDRLPGLLAGGRGRGAAAGDPGPSGSRHGVAADRRGRGRRPELLVARAPAVRLRGHGRRRARRKRWRPRASTSDRPSSCSSPTSSCPG